MNDIEMTIKYWLYFLKNDDGTIDTEPYAYTDNKDMAKRFEIERNMNKFKKVKRKLTREEINFLAYEFQTGYMEDVDLDVYDKSTMEWHEIHYVMTGNEKLTVGNLSLSSFDDLYTCCMYNPKIFNDKIKNALYIIHYNQIYNKLSGDSDNDDRYSYEVISDPLGIFIRHYGKTLKGGL